MINLIGINGQRRRAKSFLKDGCIDVEFDVVQKTLPPEVGAWRAGRVTAAVEERLFSALKEAAAEDFPVTNGSEPRNSILKRPAGDDAEGRRAIFPGEREASKHFGRLTRLGDEEAEAAFDVSGEVSGIRTRKKIDAQPVDFLRMRDDDKVAVDRRANICTVLPRITRSGVHGFKGR